MAEPTELLDYDEDEELTMPVGTGATTVGGGVSSTSAAATTTTTAFPKKDSATTKDVKKGYVGIHSTGFRDFLLKPELLKAIHECGFEHPSEGIEDYCVAMILIFTLCLFVEQFNKNVFLRPFWEWMFCAKPSLGWVRPPYLC